MYCWESLESIAEIMDLRWKWPVKFEELGLMASSGRNPVYCLKQKREITGSKNWNFKIECDFIQVFKNMLVQVSLYNNLFIFSFCLYMYHLCIVCLWPHLSSLVCLSVIHIIFVIIIIIIFTFLYFYSLSSDRDSQYDSNARIIFPSLLSISMAKDAVLVR